MVCLRHTSCVLIFTYLHSLLLAYTFLLLMPWLQLTTHAVLSPHVTRTNNAGGCIFVTCPRGGSRLVGYGIGMLTTARWLEMFGGGGGGGGGTIHFAKFWQNTTFSYFLHLIYMGAKLYTFSRGLKKGGRNGRAYVVTWNGNIDILRSFCNWLHRKSLPLHQMMDITSKWYFHFSV